ncbi:MAG: hypothetical protein ACE366_24930 [Bradymonadia bacterium]
MSAQAHGRMLAICATLLSLTTSAHADLKKDLRFKSRGELALESRVFPDDDNADTIDQAIGLFGRLEAKAKQKPFRQKLRVFGRVDERDRQRSTFVVEEAWAEMRLKDFRLKIGVDIVNWTATEAFHPADVLNSRNLDSDIENFEKVGEPMVTASYGWSGGRLYLYFMPFFVKPIFTSPNSRLAFGAGEPNFGGFDLRRPIRTDRDGELTDEPLVPQGAARIVQTIGSADISVHALHQADRSQPYFTFDPQAMQPRLLFQEVFQVGGTYQQVFEFGLITKLEAAHRMFYTGDAIIGTGPVEDRDHTQVAVGLEYGIPHEFGGESTLIVEGQSYFGVSEEIRQFQLGIFQRDALVGWRLALNDEDSTEIFASVIVDVEREEEILANLSYKQRFFDTWSAALAVRWYHAPQKEETPIGLELLDRADHLRLNITRYF